MNPNGVRPWIVGVCMLSAGLTGGYFAGRAGTGATPTNGHTAEPSAATPATSPFAKKGDKPARTTTTASNAPRSVDEIVAKLRQVIAQGNNQRTMQNALEAAQQLSPADVPVVLAQLRSLSGQQNFYAILSVLIPRWAEADPEAALAYAKTLTRTNERQVALTAVFSGWARRDVDAAMAAVEGLKSNEERHAAWSAILAELAQKSPERAVELHLKNLAKGDSQFGYKYGTIQSIFTMWAQTDPAAAAARAMKLTSRDRDMAFSGIAAQWAAKDLQGALAWAQGLPDGNAKRLATQGVLLGMANQDPQAAATYALTLKGTAQQVAMSSVAGVWAQTDFTGALAWSQNLTDPKARERALQSLGSEWTRRDPQGAVAYANSLPPGQAKNNLIYSIASSWANTDSKAALEWVQTLPTGQSRNNAMQSVVSQVSSRDPAEVAAWLEAMPDGSGRISQYYSSIASQWAEQDPEKAAEWVKKLPPGQGQLRAAQNIVFELAEANPKMAAEFTLSMPAALSQQSISGVASRWAAHDLKGAMDWAQQLPEGSGRNSALEGITSTWAQNDPKAAAQWATELGASDTKGNVLRIVAGGWAQSSPTEAAAWVATLPAGKEQNSAALSIVRSWGNQDPAGAAAWVEAFPEGQTRDSAMSSVVSSWTQSDPQGASKWLETLPPGKSRDRAAESFVTPASYQDPALAAKWAQELFTSAPAQPGQPTRNTDQLENIARNWMRMDEKAARAWIEQAPLSEEKKKTLLTPKP